MGKGAQAGGRMVGRPGTIRFPQRGPLRDAIAESIAKDTIIYRGTRLVRGRLHPSNGTAWSHSPAHVYPQRPPREPVGQCPLRS